MKRRVLMVVMLCMAALLTLGTGVASARGGATGGGGGGGGGGTATGGGGGGGSTATDSADLQITGSASTRSPDPGSAFTYTYTVKNSGPASATNVVFSDLLPANVTPNFAVGADSTTNCTLVGDLTGGTTVQCALGLVVKGGQTTVQLNVTAPQVAQAITNTATVTSAVADPRADNNTLTIDAAVKAATGGVCKGGVCDTVPDAVAAPCATLTSVTAPVGYYSTFAAVWNDFTIQSCSTGSQSLTVQVTETNEATGSVDYNVMYPVLLTTGQNVSYVLDNDFAPFNTSYRIDYTVRDSSGNVLGTAQTTATTPPPR